MSGWDAPTGSWDTHEEPEGPAESDEQGYQQGSFERRSHEHTQPGGFRAARGSEPGVLRAGRRGLPGYEQAQQWKTAGALLLAYSSDSEVLHGGYSAAMARIKG